MADLLKTASVRVSSTQIMQVRVQNKGKSVWKSRYDGDVSTDFWGSHKKVSGSSVAFLILYVSIVSTFPNIFALVLDSNLHDLSGTNPD